MPLYVDDTDSLYKLLRSNVSGEIPELTDFSENSPEYTLLHGEAEYFHILEHARLATQLSGWVKYAGGPITQDDLRELYPPARREYINLELLNSFMSDYDLNQLGELMGVDRDPGAYATGIVILTFAGPGGQVPAGFNVATVPGPEGNFLGFETTEPAEAAEGDLTVKVPIRAVERGDKYNVASNTIEYIPPGQDIEGAASVTSVTNPEATSNGEDAEPNYEYRRRIQRALTHASQGGTVAGIKGAVIEAYDGVDLGDVLIDQHHGDTPPTTLTFRGEQYSLTNWGEVYVNGGPDKESIIQDLILKNQPSTILHILRRPYVYEIDTKIKLAGTDIDQQRVGNAVTTFLSNRTLGENIVDKQLLAEIMSVDADIEDFNIDLLITNEPHTFMSNTDEYALRSPARRVAKVTGTVTGKSHTFTEGTDYTVVDKDSDGHPESVSFAPNGTNPDTGTTFTVAYEAAGDVFIRDSEVADPGVVSVTVAGNDPVDVQ